MKFKILLFLMYFGLFTNKVYSCADWRPFFSSPKNYIDIAYQAPEFSDVDYDQRKKFRQLLIHYADIARSEFVLNDSYSRALSKKQEPDNYNIYLKGVNKFNNGKYKEALEIFTQLKNSKQSFKNYLLSSDTNNHYYSWSKEVATYMIARCYLRISQENYDGFNIADINRKILLQADASFRRYVQEYPNGLYANSARNINRYLLRLFGNQDRLNKKLKQMMLKIFPISSVSTASADKILSMMYEFSIHFTGEINIAYDSPLLVAYAFLSDTKPSLEDMITLERRERDFKNYPDLFRYVRALGLYKLGQYQELLDKTPQEKLAQNILSRSIQFLRYQSLLKLSKSKDAFETLFKLYSTSPEEQLLLEITNLKLNNGDGLWFYTNKLEVKTNPDLGIGDRTYFFQPEYSTFYYYSENRYLSFVANFLTNKELKNGIRMKNIKGHKRKILVDQLARRFDELLGRYLLLQKYKQLSLLLSNNQGTGLFIPIKSAILTLAKNHNNNQALVDVGEFIYRNHNILSQRDFYDSEASEEMIFAGCKPCKKFEQSLEQIFNNNKYAKPFDFFMLVAKNAKLSNKKGEAEAKALHYLTKCYRWAENQERCIGNLDYNADDESDYNPISKASFKRLHKLYPNSEWAKKTPYYY